MSRCSVQGFQLGAPQRSAPFPPGLPAQPPGLIETPEPMKDGTPQSSGFQRALGSSSASHRLRLHRPRVLHDTSSSTVSAALPPVPRVSSGICPSVRPANVVMGEWLALLGRARQPPLGWAARAPGNPCPLSAPHREDTLIWASVQSPLTAGV